MKPTHATIALTTVLALASMNVFAADGSVTPGEWEVTTQMKMTGVPYAIPPQTTRQCITAEDLARSGGAPAPQPQGKTACTMGDFRKSADGAEWTMTCAGDADLRMQGKITYDSATQYHGTVHMTGSAKGHATEMMQTITARRIGDCVS